jgi:hypothetical protein
MKTDLLNLLETSVDCDFCANVLRTEKASGKFSLQNKSKKSSFPSHNGSTTPSLYILPSGLSTDINKTILSVL